jgi:hypothetical protein
MKFLSNLFKKHPRFRLIKRERRMGPTRYYVEEWSPNTRGSYGWQEVFDCPEGFAKYEDAKKWYDKCLEMPNGYKDEVLGIK